MRRSNEKHLKESRRLVVERLERRDFFSGNTTDLGDLVGREWMDGTLDVGATTDVHFKLADSGWVDVRSVRGLGSGRNVLQLYNARGDQMADSGGAELPGINTELLPAGDYSLRIRNNGRDSADYHMAITADYAGGSPAAARSCGAFLTARSYVDELGLAPSSRYDKYDWYQFTTASPCIAVFNLSGVVQNTQLAIYQELDGNGEPDLVAKTQGAGSLGISHSVRAGTFYVRLVSLTEASNPSDKYTLTTARQNLVMKPKFVWSMADRYGIDSNNNGLIDLPNSKTYVSPKGYLLSLDATDSTANVPLAKVQWTFAGGDLVKPLVITSTKSTTAQATLPAGKYKLQLSLIDSIGVTASVTQTIQVKDYLIVALGDSYGSGEGNPEIAATDFKKVKWADGVSASMTRENYEAHRSTACYSSQAALMLERMDPHSSVTYVNLAQSGAEVHEGVLDPWQGRNTPSYVLPAQIGELAAILGTRKIDSLVVSIGGNDFGFSDFISSLIQRNAVVLPSLNQIRSDAKTKLAKVRRNLADLSNALDAFEIGQTYITAYPDMTQVSPGVYTKFATDVFPTGLLGISADSAKFASKELGAPLNATIKIAAANYGWSFVDGYLHDFLSHGYAASDAWFRTMTVARKLQGSETSVLPGLVPLSLGGFHPSSVGHLDEAKYLFDALKAELLGATN